MTSKQVSEMNSSLVNEIYKMLRKYLALRNIVKNLRVGIHKVSVSRDFFAWDISFFFKLTMQVSCKQDVKQYVFLYKIIEVLQSRSQ